MPYHLATPQSNFQNFDLNLGMSRRRRDALPLGYTPMSSRNQVNYPGTAQKIKPNFEQVGLKIYRKNAAESTGFY
jgi:hypothetical protein